MSAPAHAPLVVVMGVSGCGKSTVGAALADRLRIPFQDADDLHPDTNIDKMARGIPLTDDDRAPWLATVGRELAQSESTGLVIACSALRTAYRDILRAHAANVVFVHLAATRNVLAARMMVRSAHFMPLSLLESQLATLEPLSPQENGLTADADQSIERILGIAEPAIRALAAEKELS
ncbi:gluconokinase [Microbacterium capsulatum]|uniref:Gluconokinase n=1 Tax=Microbacterium capsulatum TaxID=3041921 RepID=A0ABU0XKI4_9MICO|nr:gluconokinase [Microbacterium sp. ASV81]MDQ4215149.1 gluconokinase [Microbacterium sp. ASV81]